MRLSTFSSIALLFIFVFAAQTTFAQTPDEEPPAVETICDPLKSATPGLYGLCVAYCEAQDCHDDPVDLAECQAENPNDPWGTQGCSCSRVLDNYNAKRQAGDPEMPCIKTECPCFDADLLAAEVIDIGVCLDTNTATREQTLVNGVDDLACPAVAQAFTNFDNSGAPTAVVCQAFARDRDPGSGICVTTLNTIQSGLTDAEFMACQDLIRARCAP